MASETYEAVEMRATDWPSISMARTADSRSVSQSNEETAAPARVAPAPASALLSPSVETPKPGSVENSVVKVFSTARYPDPYRPWTKQSPTDLTGTGVVIDVKEPACSFEVMNPGRATGLVAMPLVIELNPPGGNASHA